MNQLAKHPSPPLLPVALVHVVLFIAGLAVPAVLAGGAFFPPPFDPEHAQRHFAEHADAVRVGSFFLFGSAVPLGVFVATASSRLAFFGVRVAGVNIALLGGSLASGCLMLSGLCMWGLGQPGLAVLPGALRVLHLLAFATGGPGFAVAFGLFVLGVSFAAGLTRRLPRWLMWLGLAIGIVAELSSLSLLHGGAAFLLPLARFPGLVWLVGVGMALPVARERAVEEGGHDGKTA